MTFREYGPSNKDLQFIINDDAFLELLFLRIRSESVKFFSVLNKKNNKTEKAWKEDTNYLETPLNYGGRF